MKKIMVRIHGNGNIEQLAAGLLEKGGPSYPKDNAVRIANFTYAFTNRLKINELYIINSEPPKSEGASPSYLLELYAYNEPSLEDLREYTQSIAEKAGFSVKYLKVQAGGRDK